MSSETNNVILDSKIIAVDKLDGLTCYHYDEVNVLSPNDIKQYRGIIKEDDTDNIVCKTFGFTPEFGANDTENLKTYLNEFRMLTDGVNIIDGFIINIGVNFDITVYKNFNNREVVLKCIEELKSFFAIENWQFNQTINISDIELTLAMVEGVASVQNLEIVNKCGGSYARNSYDIKGATKNKIIYPSLDPSIFEVKFPDKDIKGRAI